MQKKRDNLIKKEHLWYWLPYIKMVHRGKSFSVEEWEKIQKKAPK